MSEHRALPHHASGRRVALAALVVLLLAGACVPAAPAVDPAAPDLAALASLDLDAFAADEVLRAAREFTVRIRALGCDRLGTGSGFVLDDGLIVTNRHVVGQPREITISTWDGRSFDAVVEGIALDADLAVIQVIGAALPVATLRREPVVVGEAIAVIGYPGGGPATITTGKVLGFTDGGVLGERTPAIVVDAEVRQGNSGGPLIDARGHVVGVIFALSGETGAGLAVPADVLLERLATRGFTPPEGC
jgi:S1-C subfamily serine protease